MFHADRGHSEICFVSDWTIKPAFWKTAYTFFLKDFTHNMNVVWGLRKGTLVVGSRTQQVSPRVPTVRFGQCAQPVQG